MKLLFADFTLPYLLRDAQYPVGGWAVELLSWLKALNATGQRAGVLTWRGAVDYVGPQDVCDLLETYDPKKGIRVLKYAYSYVPKMVAAARSYQPDAVIQACAGIQTGMMAYVAGRLGVPFAHRIASDSDSDDRYKERLPWFERVGFSYGMNRAATILCQNAYQVEALRVRYPETRLAIIRNPYDGVPGPTRPRRERSYVAWLGVFRKEKNLPLLLEIARTLPSVQFRIGGMPPKVIDPDTAAALSGLEALPNVEFAGYLGRGAVHDFLSHAIAVLCTSDFEGFSNVFLEAFGAGAPVLSQRSVDPDLVITTKGLGLTTDDAPGLVDAAKRIVAMGEGDYAAMSERCRVYVVENHAGAERVRELEAALAPAMARRA